MELPQALSGPSGVSLSLGVEVISPEVYAPVKGSEHPPQNQDSARRKWKQALEMTVAPQRPQWVERVLAHMQTTLIPAPLLLGASWNPLRDRWQRDGNTDPMSTLFCVVVLLGSSNCSIVVAAVTVWAWWAVFLLGHAYIPRQGRMSILEFNRTSLWFFFFWEQFCIQFLDSRWEWGDREEWVRKEAVKSREVNSIDWNPTEGLAPNLKVLCLHSMVYHRQCFLLAGEW